MAEVSGRRPLRPFPAFDPEPPRRLTWRSLRWPAIACAIAGVVAAAFLAWRSSSPSASRSARVPFADRNGLGIAADGGALVLATHDPEVVARCDHSVSLARHLAEPAAAG